MITGLTEEEVVKQRKKYGNNKIQGTNKNSFFKLFIESLGDPIIKILIIALLVKVIFLFRDFDFFETIGILLSILIASFVSTISEYGSEAAFQKLEEESSKIKVKVYRENKKKEIFIEEVVVDDIVILNSGDKVPADGNIIKGKIEIDESSINGETESKEKIKNNNIFRGTIVTSGECLLKVTKVGENTEYGSIAKELISENTPSPLKIRLTQLAKQISKIGYIGAVLVACSYLFSKLIIENNFNFSLIKNDILNSKLMFTYLLHALTISVTVIVVSVPEGLPLMITLVLSSNMRRMLKDKVLVRKLVGIETSGNINYLLTDKTGTLTEGKLTVSHIFLNDQNIIHQYNTIENKKIKDIIYASIYYNNSSDFDELGNAIGGNTTDKALLNFIKKDPDKNNKIIKYQPFSSENKYSYVIVEDEEITTYFKGSPELILSKCQKCLTSTGDIIFFKDKDKIEKQLNEYTKKGMRVIALAMSNSYHITNLARSLTFIGLVVIKDKLRTTTIPCIEILKESGITPIMITGDDKNTAYAIAKETGIISSSEDICLTSNDLKQMKDDDIIKIHKKIKVIARAMPKDKSRLVSILQSLNYVVGMTGDGVNDGPALKKADVGFALGSGTEVAKEASDIIILDDNIKSITKAISYGRTIYKSIKKFIIFQLALNICAVTISIIGPFIGVETPITIVQMLWINMIMDTFAGIAFSYEPPLQEYMKEKPKKRDEKIIDSYMKSEIILSGFYQAIICIFFLKLPLIRNFIRPDEKYIMTCYFSLFIFMGIFNAFNARTTRLNILANIKQNKPFIFIITSIIIAQIFIIYNGGTVFRTYGLTIKELLLSILLAFTIIPIDSLRKFLITTEKIDK